MGCTGVCTNPIYENDGVCNVPQPCAVGTDCADCKTDFPTIPLITTCMSGLLFVFTLVTICLRFRVFRRRQSDELTSFNSL